MIFISHSSKDKAIVRKLSADLIVEGIPIWLDEKELEPANVLRSSLADAIEQASYLVVIISESSNASTWVDQEIDWALEKEKKLGRSFLIPIQIDNTEANLKVNGRVYVDLSSSYANGLNRLIDFFDGKGLKGVRAPITQLSLPLVFSEHIHLDYWALRASLSHALAEPDSVIRPDQFFIVLEDDYVELKNRIFARLDNIESDSHYTAAFAAEYKDRVRWLRKVEANLIKGVAFILNRFYLDADSSFSGAFEACHSFALCWRSELIRRLYETQNPDLPPLLLGKDFAKDGSGSSGANAHLFGRNNNPQPHRNCHLGVTTSHPPWGETIQLYDQSDIHERFVKLRNVPMPVPDALSDDQIAWFLIPQLTAKHLGGWKPRSDWRSFLCGLA